MTSYEKRDSVKLEGVVNSVKGILESIIFKQETEHYTCWDGSTKTYYTGQAKDQIKNKIKVARAMLMDISKELDK